VSAEPDSVIEVPWNRLPISEAFLPAEASLAFLRETGWPIWTTALVSVLEEIPTTRARELILKGEVTVDGAPAHDRMEYIRAGALVRVGGKTYRLGQPWPDAYGGR